VRQCRAWSSPPSPGPVVRGRRTLWSSPRVSSCARMGSPAVVTSSGWRTPGRRRRPRDNGLALRHALAKDRAKAGPLRLGVMGPGARRMPAPRSRARGRTMPLRPPGLLPGPLRPSVGRRVCALRRRLPRQVPGRGWLCPVNEPYMVAMASGGLGVWNDRRTSDADFALALAHCTVANLEALARICADRDGWWVGAGWHRRRRRADAHLNRHAGPCREPSGVVSPSWHRPARPSR